MEYPNFLVSEFIRSYIRITMWCYLHFLIEKLEEKIKEPIKEPSEEPLPMETEEEDPKEEPIKEIKEVKGHFLLTWEPALIVGYSLLVTENLFAIVLDNCCKSDPWNFRVLWNFNLIFPLKISLNYFLRETKAPLERKGPRPELMSPPDLQTGTCYTFKYNFIFGDCSLYFTCPFLHGIISEQH